MKKATQSKSKGSPAKKTGKAKPAKQATKKTTLEIEVAEVEVPVVEAPVVAAEATVLTNVDEPKGEPEAAASNPTKNRSCLDAAAQVLKDKGEPMRCKDMIAAMLEANLWHSTAPTPHATLYSAILREITTKGGESRFKKTDRGHFALNA